MFFPSFVDIYSGSKNHAGQHICWPPFMETVVPGNEGHVVGEAGVIDRNSHQADLAKRW
jgi:hypothetical protein